jgi:glycosyltransferase involved in cell wall biosynthesis
MKNVLMIAFHFIPDLEVGAVRTAKFAQYLPRYGWNPVILTVKEKYYSNRDKINAQSDSIIYRTGVWPNLRNFYLFCKRLFSMSNNSKQDLQLDAISDDLKRHEIKKTPYWKRFLSSLSWTPDDKLGWLIPGVIKAFFLVRKYKCKIIYSSGPPWTGHLIALIIKKLIKVQWVADFRDPWTLVPKLEKVSTNLSNLIEKRLETSILTNADKIICVSDGSKISFLRRFSHLDDCKVETILNGFDLSDFKHITDSNVSKSKILTFTYSGTIYVDRNPGTFLNALGLLIRNNSINRNEVRVKFVGNVESGFSDIQKAIKEYNLDNVVEFIPPLPKKQYFQLLMQSDILLYLQPEWLADLAIPAKIYDYIGSGKHILALVEPGAAKDLLKCISNKTIIAPDNEFEIVNYLDKVFREYRSGHCIFEKADKPTRLERSYLTEKLSDILNDLYC